MIQVVESLMSLRYVNFFYSSDGHYASQLHNILKPAMLLPNFCLTILRQFSGLIFMGQKV
jgi:hypothetical protein